MMVAAASVAGRSRVHRCQKYVLALPDGDRATPFLKQRGLIPSPDSYESYRQRRNEGPDLCH
jgi:hypothetical protein